MVNINLTFLQNCFNSIGEAFKWMFFESSFSLAFFSAAETKCNFNNNTSFCSVTLGGSVFVQIMTNASGHQLWCKKQLPIGSMNVFSLKKEKVMIQDAYKNRTEFFISNGTLKIAHVERNDSGQYSIEVFDPNGIQVKNIILTLDVQGKCLKSKNVCSSLFKI